MKKKLIASDGRVYRYALPKCHPDRKHRAHGLCEKCYEKRRYVRNKEYFADKHARWSAENRQHLNQYIRKRTKRLVRENPVKVVLQRIKYTSKKRGILFTITESDLAAVWSDTCPVYGVPISIRTKRTNNSLSVDRIDSKLGYVPGNICIMSWRANRLKFDASLEELEQLVRYLRGLRRKKNARLR
jgi:hypothetical protein